MLPSRRGLLRLLLKAMATRATDPQPPWEALHRELLGFVRSRVRDPAAAADIVQDVLTKALRELEGPEPPQQLRGWLFRVTRNAIVDHYRMRRSTEELPEEIGEATPEEEATAEEELARCLSPLLAALPAADRQALTLTELEGRPQKELAAAAGLSLPGAKSRLLRARQKLRQALLDCCRLSLDARGGVLDFEPRDASAPCAGEGGGGRCGPAPSPAAAGPGRSERPKPYRVLFLCTHNSARSQMAEAIARSLGAGRIEAHSAGSAPGTIHPLAIETMAAEGLELGGQRSKHVDEYRGQSFDSVITVCDRANESCPIFPGAPERIHWSLPDPTALPTEAGRRKAFRRTAAELRRRIGELLRRLDQDAPGRA